MTNMKRALRLVPVPALWLLAAAVTAAEPDWDTLYGSWEFGDGVRVTGGPFTEGGERMLLYMDTREQRRGGLFRPAEQGFASTLGPARLAFEEGARIMRWTDAGGEVLTARRVMSPARRPAGFANGEVHLGGTLFLPPGRSEPVPAIVLAHGSGPGSRHAGTWITFFLEQGLAVLSFDKRGVGESSGDWRTATYFDLAGDLNAGVDWLRAQEGIDPRRVGVHTSSQSGWYGPHAARTNPGIAFLVQRAGPAVDIGIGTAHERREEWRAEGLEAPVIEAAARFWLDLHDLAAAGAPRATAQVRLEEAREQPWFGPAYGEWERIGEGWWSRLVDNRRLEPAADAAALRIPVLWFLAELDQNVPYAASMAALELAQKANPKMRVVTVHGADHSFLWRGEQGRMRYTDEYWQVISGWLPAAIR